MTPQLAQRLQHTQTFHAMEIFMRTMALQAQGRDIISLGIGEPDFTAAPAVVSAMKAAADQGLGKYGPAAGIMPLRQAIAQFYGEQLGAQVDPKRIIVTNGASGALLLASLALINPGQEVIMPDPCYPANSNFIMAAGGVTKLVRTEAQSQFQLTADDITANWTDQTAGVLIASPGNPTGTSIEPEQLREIIKVVHARSGFVMMDEIYLGLSYRDARRSALTIHDNLIILNSFSKYFHMTGWRLGWMIVPPELVAPIEKLASSLMICPPTLAQHGALACFEPKTIELLEHRREAFRARRDFLVQALESIGFDVPARPDGAFYVYADISRFSNDSDRLVDTLLDQAGVALVPGIDFG
ncbi:MAG: pyridoxal phosphate-dependent aminotransferase, partial [Burkholderiaceae bacterium]|nr:pyridoxal phosphate-dependent aminotransferase [Burkholderiaceae bacterium]